MVGNYLLVLFVWAETNKAFLRAACKTLWLLETLTSPLPARSLPGLLPPTAPHLLGYRHALQQAAAAPSKELHIFALIWCPARLFSCDFTSHIFLTVRLATIHYLVYAIHEFYWNQYNFVQVLRSAHQESKKHATGWGHQSPVLQISSVRHS